ncbi:MAG TPA: protein kinase [Candidatus Cryosericum sp.]|nr:protein kinase [Candidatus Cryosericum sp.]
MLKPEETCMCCFAQLTKPKGVCPKCGCDNAAVYNEAHQLECGSILAGTYLIGKVLGQGGFGITYIGWDLNLDIKVAIKEYYPEGCVTRDAHTHISVLTYAGPKEAYFQKGKERFVNEAKALAKFPGDSGVVGVRTFFYENGTAYIVMDFVEGETLKAYAQRRGGKLPAAEVLSLFQPIFRSLARVHDSGLLHRDISPDNLMLKTDGTLALLDFGAARQISAEGEHSNTINVKHGFAPEEQYRTRGEQGPWTDVYALSATIYRLTTGRTPPEALERMADGTLLTPPNQLGADFTPAQEAAILHGLAVRASDRTRDVRQLEKELYGGERTVFTAQPVSASYEPAAPQSSFVTQPLTRSVEPTAPTAPQPSYAAQPQPASAEPAKYSSASAGSTADAASLENAGQQETNSKKKRKALTIATYIAFAILLIMTLFAFSGLGGFLLIGLLILDAIGLFWILLHKGVLKNVDQTGKIEKAASLITLSGGALALALILAGVIVTLSAPSAPASAQAATEPPAAAVEMPGATLDPNIVIDWQDPTIEAGIRSALGRGEGEPITTGDVAYIYSLKIAGDTLYINDDSVWPYVNTYDNTYSVDNGVTSLPISEQTISVTDLANFSGLTALNVYAVNVSGLESLKNCLSLNSVILDACGNIDLNEFSSCDYLYDLSISDCDGVVLAGAGEKLFIGSLSLSNCGTVDAWELTQFSNLYYLSVWDCPVSSIEQIGSMTNLTSLSLSNTGASNFDFLRNLTLLDALSLSGLEITEIPSLDAMTNLQTLNLTYCTLDNADIQQLASYTGLTSLMLDGCPFSDLSFVKNLTNLTIISFDNSQVRDITPLKNLTKLETLWLLSLDISDISALKYCKSLNRVYIVNTQVSDYSSLEGLPIEYISVDAAYSDQVRSILPNATVDSW